MPNYRRARIRGATYFFTVVTGARRWIFHLREARELLQQAMERTRQSHPFEQLAYALLPEHLHTIWRLPQGRPWGR